MKRYRVLIFDFDYRANILSMEIKDEWEEKVKETHRKNKEKCKEGLLSEFGEIDFEHKLINFCDMGPKEVSVVAFHNKFFEQARRAFTIGAYFSALTSVCALGERILNHLILLFRDEFKNTSQFKQVYRKKSFDNWDLAIDTLQSWSILLEDVAKSFSVLHSIRNRAIHFDPVTDTRDRQLALEAIHCLGDIISKQFGAFGPHPWFIKNDIGISFIKKTYEKDPFVKKIYIPNSYLVGPKHKLEDINGQWKVSDDHKYEERHVTDEEFVNLFKKYNKG